MTSSSSTSSSSSVDLLVPASVGTLVLSGLGAGLMHVVVSPDHISAFLVLSAGSSWREGELGAIWGVGHSLSLLLTASIYFATDRGLDLESMSFVFEFLVGLLLVLLGLWALNRFLDIRKRVSRGESVRAILHGDDNDLGQLYEDSESCASSPSVLAGFGPFWTANESHQLEVGPRTRPVDSFKLAGRRRCCCRSGHTTTRRGVSFALGVIHGLAEQSSVVAVLSGDHVIDDYGKCMTYLLTESAALTLAMAAVVTLVGEVSGRVMHKSDALYYRVGIASAIVSLVAGLLWIALVETDALGDVFS